MRFSPPSSPLQLLFPAFAAAVLTISPLATHAQDSILQTNGTVRQGQIVRVARGSAMIKIGAGEVGVPFAQISQIQMATPAPATRGLQLQEAGKVSDAIAALKPVVEQFGGLPTEWAQQATAALGDLYLSQNNMKEAAAAYSKFKALYPGAGLSLQADVGMARIAAADGKNAQARATLEPVVATALTKADVSKAESAAFGQAYYTLGSLDEKDGKFAEALQNYLRTVTIFYADRATAARAQERADALRKAHPVAVP
ncbi:MAG TPA: hypothetical protein VIT91_12890 [Chthoniobacterales bacterium]